jgi:hypothetical protein
MDSISNALLDELAGAAVGLPCHLAVPADPIVRPETPPEPGKGLAKSAATLIVTGSWGHHARFRGVASREAERPRERKESEGILAGGKTANTEAPRRVVRPDR